MTNTVAMLARGADHAVRTLRRTSPVSIAREAAAAAFSAALYPLGYSETGVDYVVGLLAGNRAPVAQKSTPVVLVHGYGSIKSHWLNVHIDLRLAGYQVDAINYNPAIEDIPAIAGRLVDMVNEILSDPKVSSDKVHLVGHSMGGLVIRYAVEVLGLGDRVDVAVTVLTPHKGSPWAHVVDLVPAVGPMKRVTRRAVRAASQMQPGSRFLTQLSEASELNALCHTHEVRFIAYAGEADIVVPAELAELDTPGAVNIVVPGLGHISPLLYPALCDDIVARIGDAERPQPTPAPAAA